MQACEGLYEPDDENDEGYSERCITQERTCVVELFQQFINGIPPVGDLLKNIHLTKPGIVRGTIVKEFYVIQGHILLHKLKWLSNEYKSSPEGFEQWKCRSMAIYLHVVETYWSQRGWVLDPRISGIVEVFINAGQTYRHLIMSHEFLAI